MKIKTIKVSNTKSIPDPIREDIMSEIDKFKVPAPGFYMPDEEFTIFLLKYGEYFQSVEYINDDEKT